MRTRERVVTLVSALVIVLGGLTVMAVTLDPQEVPAAQELPSDKVFVCKYVGTPGVDEVLQSGQNPISVSVNSIPAGVPIVVGAIFADAQGQSIIIAFDVGQNPEPGPDACPRPTGPTTVPPTTEPPTTLPPPPPPPPSPPESTTTVPEVTTTGPPNGTTTINGTTTTTSPGATTTAPPGGTTTVPGGTTTSAAGTTTTKPPSTVPFCIEHPGEPGCSPDGFPEVETG